jgi:hypothetical protein
MASLVLKNLKILYKWQLGLKRKIKNGFEFELALGVAL